MTAKEEIPLLKSGKPTNEIDYYSHHVDGTPDKVVWTLEEDIDNVGVGTYQIFIFGRIWFSFIQSCGTEILIA